MGSSEVTESTSLSPGIENPPTTSVGFDTLTVQDLYADRTGLLTKVRVRVRAGVGVSVAVSIAIVGVTDCGCTSWSTQSKTKTKALTYIMFLQYAP